MSLKRQTLLDTMAKNMGNDERESDEVGHKNRYKDTDIFDKWCNCSYPNTLRSS